MLVLDKPGYQLSIHVNVYLHTAGKEANFIEDLALLESTIEEVFEKYPNSVLYIRGDANASAVPRKHNKRDVLFQHFLGSNNLTSVPTNHTTYHHFTNEGLSDSSIDVLLFTKVTSEGFPNNAVERLLKVLCSKDNSMIDSSHDALISDISFPPIPSISSSSETKSAPRVPNTKYKVTWSEEGITEYQELLAQTLPGLHLDSDDLPPDCASVLFATTNDILTAAAKQTNEFVELASSNRPRKVFTPPEVKKSMQIKNAAHKKLLGAQRDPTTTDTELKAAETRYRTAKAENQRRVRETNVSRETERDCDLQDPFKLFLKIKSNKSKQLSKLKSLQVGDQVYSEDRVADGFFHNIKSLKTIHSITATSFERFSEDHRHIIEICKSGSKIPRISLEDSLSLLKRIKPSVSDFYSITAAHYVNGGQVALVHFQLLLNTVLNNIEIAAIDELNTTHAVILHKGHGKDKNVASSYRTISCCPFIAKAADMYLGDLSKDDWQSCQAETQFQGDNMSHELAALLVTIAIAHSLNMSLPAFILLLDAKSAFDLVLREILVRRLYLDTTPDQRIRYFDLRLANRTTYCQWDGQLMGPIRDELGEEQGGPNSSELYKIYNNEQLTTAQDSSLGISMQNIHVAAAGQADDCALMSNNIFNLQHLLQLSLNYCAKYQVELSAEKTKLLVFSPNNCDAADYAKLISPIHIGNTVIPFVDTAEHVGVLRSVSGNLPHIHQRIVKHRKALASVLFTGMSRCHRASPLASLQTERIFGSPVLFSGLATLILTKPETDIIAQHVQQTTQNLLKLHQKTPDVVIFMISGTFPGEAMLNLKQLTLFGMITRLPDNILNQIAIQSFLNGEKKSWFSQILLLCHQYGLPHPLTLLQKPFEKTKFKSLIKLKVSDYWQTQFRKRSSGLSSLRYFKPEFMSLLTPHPILKTVSHSYDVNKMVIQLRMLSGRYRVGSLLRHFSPSHSGLCELCGLEIEDLSHLLIPRCPSLQERRVLLLEYSRTVLSGSTVCSTILENILTAEDEELFVQFLLDCSVLPPVISAAQLDKEVLPLLFKITRTWCYSLHRTRLKLLGRWSA